MSPRRWLDRAVYVLLTAVAVTGALAGLVVRDYLFERSARRITGVSFPGGQVEVDVAVTDAERRAGLAGRTGLPPDTGLLFVYRDTAPRLFTMEGMLIDLDIISLAEDGAVTGVQTRAAGGPPLPTAPARYVLEVASGWAASHGVTVGTKARIVRGG